MDTKVEQELFGYDPTDPEGLDNMHDTILHLDFTELERRAVGQADEEADQRRVSAGVAPSLPTARPCDETVTGSLQQSK